MDRIEWGNEERYEPPERELSEFLSRVIGSSDSPGREAREARKAWGFNPRKGSNEGPSETEARGAASEAPGAWGFNPREGEPVSEAPVVFISEQALEALHQFLADDLSREHGGVLVGLPYRDPHSGQYFVDIQRAIPAFESEGTATHLQFTPAAWKFISGLLEEDPSGLMIVGWYHSHPGLGVFFSGTDLASHRAFFSQPWSAAVVVDPLIHQTGWFCGPEARRLPRRQVYVYNSERRLNGERPHPDQKFDLSWLLPLALFAAACVTGWLLLAPRWRT